MIERSIHLLACEFQIATDAEPLARWLDGVGPSAAQDHPVSRRHRFQVRHEAGGYRVREDGADRALWPSPEAAAALVEQRIHELAFAALADYTKVHAGCATWRDRRLLVVGAGGSGKSTLMTRLLYEGFAVEGGAGAATTGAAAAGARRLPTRARPASRTSRACKPATARSFSRGEQARSAVPGCPGNMLCAALVRLDQAEALRLKSDAFGQATLAKFTALAPFYRLR